MTQLTLTKTRLANGLWEGRITGTTARPDIEVTLHDRPVEGVGITETEESGAWALTIPVPPEAIADGIQTFLIADAASDVTLGHFTLIAGETDPDDLRGEVELLRAELDMLKRAFRRHCVETL
ncbi:hypothetical protein ACFO5X_09445 [Seohaeicola nanhaiensis]|uniref:Uncharacterized protein n=1 Tax=Seohaeicola nanhaiensis TaxID=1387282 RepID=A0ABV9KFI8_9RHOB